MHRIAPTAFGLIVALAFGWMMLDAATALRWAVLAVGVPVLFLLLRLKVQKEVLWLAAITVATCALTILWAPDKLTSTDELIHLLILVGVFCLGAALVDLTSIWFGLAIGIGLSGVLAIGQFFGYSPVNEMVPPSGLFMNKNMLAEAGGLAVILCVAYRWWWLLTLALVAWLLPRSFAAFGSVVLAAALFLYPTRPKFSLVLVLALSVGTICAFAFHLPSADIRLTMWENTLGQLSWTGYGFGSFVAFYPEMEFAHSEVAQLLFELGIFSLPLFVIFYFALEESGEPERSILIAVLANSFFSFPMHMPLTAFAAALAAGHLVARRYRLRSPYAGRSIPPSEYGERRKQNVGSIMHNGQSGSGYIPAVFTYSRQRNGNS